MILRFSTDKDFISTGIKLFTQSKFSHVDVYLGNNEFLSALPKKGVCIHNEPVGYEEYYSLDINGSLSNKFLLDQLGKPYDWTAIWGFLLHKRNWQEDDKWFCSELIAAAINLEQPIYSKALHRITPKDLLKSPFLIPL